jgi:hypothetical protein
MTSFQRAVVVLTAAAVMLQLLYPPTYGVRPDVSTTLFHVLVTLIAGGVVAWVGFNRGFLLLLAGALLIGWAGLSIYSVWRERRANAESACDMARELVSTGARWEYGDRYAQALIITAPDGRQWPVPVDSYPDEYRKFIVVVGPRQSETGPLGMLPRGLARTRTI